MSTKIEAKAAYYTFGGRLVRAKQFQAAMGLARDYSRAAAQGRTAGLGGLRDSIFGLVGEFDFDPATQRSTQWLPPPIVDAMGQEQRRYREDM